jgi:glycosyltransferase involved in cell wall biosynthesis
MKSRLRILQIFNRYLEPGGEQASVGRMGDALQQVADVEYFLTSSDQLLGRRTPSGMVKAAAYALHNPEVIRRLKRQQELGRFDIWVVHNVFPTMSPSVYSLAFKLGIPVVQYLHNYRMSCVNGSFLNRGETCTSCMRGNFTKAALTGCWHDSRVMSGWMGAVMMRVRAEGVFRKMAAWIALSEAQKSLHVQMGIPADRIHLVPHFHKIDPTRFIESSGRDVLFLGRLSKEKGVEQLLDAWKRTDRGGAKLLIAGDGPERTALKNKISAEKIGDVDLLGFVAKEDLAALWRRASFSVVPSIWQDPLPAVVFETWERGRPVLVSDAGGLADLVEDGVDGIKVPMRDAEAWSAAMGKMLREPAKCAGMARSGAIKLHSEYSQEKWLKRIHAIYHRVSGKPAWPPTEMVTRLDKTD